MLARAADDQLLIRVSGGVGEGPTRLAAFDRALRDAGVADFNLIRLSSVIPPGATVAEVAGPGQISGQPGDRLYCVIADAYASTPSEEAWAGLAWALRTDERGGGLFVEHTGSSESAVTRDLSATVSDMIESRSGPYVRGGTHVEVACCTGHPVCAVVIATYARAGWSDE